MLSGNAFAASRPSRRLLPDRWLVGAWKVLRQITLREGCHSLGEVVSGIEQPRHKHRAYPSEVDVVADVHEVTDRLKLVIWSMHDESHKQWEEEAGVDSRLHGRESLHRKWVGYAVHMPLAVMWQ